MQDAGSYRCQIHISLETPPCCAARRQDSGPPQLEAYTVQYTKFSRPSQECVLAV
jgi:hypothetical protein